MAKISLRNDLVVVVAGAPLMSLHDYMPPDPAVPGPHLEVPTTIYWPTGAATGQNKLTSSVHSQGTTIALQSHDCGTMCPHVAPSVMLPITILTSSRKLNFSAHTVKMNGSSTGVASFWAPTPMSVCSKFVPSLGFPVTNVANTVNVGVTVGDMIAGYAAIAIGVAANVISSALSEDAGDVETELISLAVGWVAGVVAGAVQIAATGEGTVGVTVGTPPLAFSVGYTRNADGTWSKGASAGPYSRQQNADGSWQTTKPSGDVGSGQSETTTEKADGSTEKTVSNPTDGTQTTTKVPGHSAAAPSGPRI